MILVRLKYPYSSGMWFRIVNFGTLIDSAWIVTKPNWPFKVHEIDPFWSGLVWKLGWLDSCKHRVLCPLYEAAQMIKTLYMDGHMVGYGVVQVVLFDQNMAILGLRKWGKNEVGWERIARRADLEQSYVLAESTNTDRQRLAISLSSAAVFTVTFQFSFSILNFASMSTFFR